jgi:hypothetical protein
MCQAFCTLSTRWHHNATDVLHVSDQKNSRLVKVVVATQNATVATNFDD